MDNYMYLEIEKGINAMLKANDIIVIDLDYNFDNVKDGNFVVNVINGDFKVFEIMKIDDDLSFIDVATHKTISTDTETEFVGVIVEVRTPLMVA